MNWLNWLSFDNSARLRKIRQQRRTLWARPAQPVRGHDHTWVEVTRYCDLPGSRHLCTTCGISRRDT